MKQDRFLTGILIGIAVLILAALAVFFTRQNQRTYKGTNTPDGVVHDYVLALMNHDYQKAYGYLADLENKPSFDEFRRTFVTGRLGLSNNNDGVRIGAVDVNGEDASVEVDMVYSPSDPFSTGYNNVGSAQLVKQNGVWKISSMPTYNLWDYSWYQAVPK